jgi:Zn-dependent protease with chaperone function
VIRRRGRYFDGASSRALEVEARIEADGSLTLLGEGVSLRLPRHAFEVSSRLGRTPRVFLLPGGARCELDDDDELERALFTAGRGRARWLDALERHGLAAALAVVATIAALAAAVQLGIPALARAVAEALPQGADAQLGDGALRALDESLFDPSELPEARRGELARLFASLSQQAGLEAQLELRAGGAVGANAFALPGGTVVLTDELEALAQGDAEIAAVLAHELGHVARRHALRSVLQNAGVGLLVAASLGDLASISSLAATLPTVLVQLQYSRRFEREADDFAAALLAEAQLDVDALGSVLERLEQATPGAGAVPGYLSTHPETGERVRAIRRAAKKTEADPG